MKKFLEKPFPQIKSKSYEELIGFIQTATIILMVALFLGCFKIATVPTLSMYPTLDQKEFLFCQKTNSFDYGDIVLFYSQENPGETWVKRIIGLSGDTIEVKDSHVIRNGVELEEPYLNEPIAYDMEEITIPDGEFFVMGDNRNYSNDSHVIGPIPGNVMYAKMLFHCNPFNMFTK